MPELVAQQRAALAAAAVAVILAVDALIRLLDPPVSAGLAVLDEPGHLATTALILLALGAGRLGFAAAALVATVAIDLDHLPHALGSDFLTDGTPRPYTHSLVGLVAVAAVAFAVSRRPAIGLAVAIGVGGHFVRDIGSGPGLSLAWPLDYGAVRIPWVVYFGVALTLATLVVARSRRVETSA